MGDPRTTLVPLSERLEATATALGDTEMTVLGGVVEVESFIDALEHAAAIAAEVEYMSSASGQIAQTTIKPVYPPLVHLLGLAIAGAAA